MAQSHFGTFSICFIYCSNNLDWKKYNVIHLINIKSHNNLFFQLIFELSIHYTYKYVKNDHKCHGQDPHKQSLCHGKKVKYVVGIISEISFQWTRACLWTFISRGAEIVILLWPVVVDFQSRFNSIQRFIFEFKGIVRSPMKGRRITYFAWYSNLPSVDCQPPQYFCVRLRTLYDSLI